ANAKYISRNYQKNSRQWSLWARQHLPLFFQITSTNPLESYYSEIKAKVSVQYGFIAVIVKCRDYLSSFNSWIRDMVSFDNKRV
ncbi:24105_t:CDS:2, partial [Gigaspora rosea]